MMRRLLFCLMPALGTLALSLHAAPWQVLTPKEADQLGWDLEGIQAAQAFSNTLQTDAVFIAVGGKVLAEWGAIDQQFNVHSIRKSFLSALVGMKVAEGKIKLDATVESLGIDDNAPSLSMEEKSATVLDLLKARSGIYHPALYETPTMKERRPERFSHAPGTFWYYNNWDFNALGTIYEQNGDSIYEDFQKKIAEPLGMEDYSAAEQKYVTGSASIHRAYPFRMSARDMARFGQLYLQEGEWDGHRILPTEWVRDSVQSYSKAGVSGGYGYLWWTSHNGRHLPGITVPDGTYSARGYRGHFILVIPKYDLVIVHRVNTREKDRKVEAADFGTLVDLILTSKRSQIASTVAP